MEQMLHFPLFFKDMIFQRCQKALLWSKSLNVLTFQYGTTPLIWASRKGHAEIVKALLNEGANVDTTGMVILQMGLDLTKLVFGSLT